MPYAAFNANCDVVTAPTAADIARVAAEGQQPGLIIFTYKFESMRELAPLTRLEVLKISGAPDLKSLEGIEDLPQLEELVLATPTGSAGSGKRIEVSSFAPLERLTNLKRLILQEVRPNDLDLTPLMRMTHLEDFDLGGVPDFTLEHYAALARALPNTEGRCLGPYVIIPGVGRCKKCGAQSVLLNGAPPRARKWVCPNCSAKLLAAHVAKWEAVTGKPYQPSS
jgi:hypothetical protein